jgi:NAD-dependent protein deacetylase/lipoamidase
MESDIESAAKLLLQSRYVIALSGAGISVESGIRPFRGPGGIWTERGEPPMDGYQRFMQDPKRHWEEIMQRRGTSGEFSRTIGEAKPNAAHVALAELEKMGILKYLITQNIDNLHIEAGSQKVAEIHGNTQKLRCIECNERYRRDEISLDVLPPRCPKCQGIIKTDSVMFGEPIPADVLRICQREAMRADCMIAVGTSAYVYPAAGFPIEVKRRGGALIEVNLYESDLTSICDISLRGKATEVMMQLVDCIKTLKK